MDSIKMLVLPILLNLILIPLSLNEPRLSVVERLHAYDRYPPLSYGKRIKFRGNTGPQGLSSNEYEYRMNRVWNEMDKPWYAYLERRYKELGVGDSHMMRSLAWQQAMNFTVAATAKRDLVTEDFTLRKYGKKGERYFLWFLTHEWSRLYVDFYTPHNVLRRCGKGVEN